MSRTMEKTQQKGIYKRGGRYVVVYRDPSGRQRKRSCATMREARDVKKIVGADIVRGEYRALSRITVGDYAGEWISIYTGRTKRGLGEGTRDDYRGALERAIVPVLGRLRLAEVEPRDVKRLAAELSARMAPASVSKTMAPLKAMLACAVEDGLIRSNPSAGVRIAQPAGDDGEEEQVKALTEDELQAVLKHVPAEWQAFFGFLFESGLRIGEAIELRWHDVDGDWLRVDRRFYRGKVGLPKGRKKRRIRLSKSMAQALWVRRNETRPGPGDLVFTTTTRGVRIDPSNLMSRVLKPAAVAAGVGGWVGFHTFRHSCATALFRRSWNAVQVQKFLGHSDPGFTLRTYVHLLDEDVPQPDFAAPGGNAGATQPAETGRNDVAPIAAVSGL